MSRLTAACACLARSSLVRSFSNSRDLNSDQSSGTNEITGVPLARDRTRTGASHAIERAPLGCWRVSSAQEIAFEGGRSPRILPFTERQREAGCVSLSSMRLISGQDADTERLSWKRLSPRTRHRYSIQAEEPAHALST